MIWNIWLRRRAMCHCRINKWTRRGSVSFSLLWFRSCMSFSRRSDKTFSLKLFVIVLNFIESRVISNMSLIYNIFCYNRLVITCKCFGCDWKTLGTALDFNSFFLHLASIDSPLQENDHCTKYGTFWEPIASLCHQHVWQHFAILLANLHP